MNSVLHVKGLFIWGITVKTIKQQAMQFQADHVLATAHMIHQLNSLHDFLFFSWEVIYHISQNFSKNDPLTEFTTKFCPQKQSILFILLIIFCFIIDMWKIMALWVITHHRDGAASVGGSDFAIFSRTLIGFISWLGGSICASSIRVTPRDQMSAL